MLRQTCLTRHQMTVSNPMLPRVLDRMTPGKMENILIMSKERRKRQRYLGSAFMHFNDRYITYAARGGVRKGYRYIIEQQKNRIQYLHVNNTQDHWQIRSIKTAGAQYDMIGNYTRTGWDNSVCTTNVSNDLMLKQRYSHVAKDLAIETLEDWGVKYVVIDEIRKPRLEDCKYHRHSLFASKFYWDPFPETNHRVGEADFKWRGDEEIPYADYGASTKSPKNTFHSMWRASQAAQQKETNKKATATAAAATA